MTLPKRRPIVKATLVFGSILFVIHSFSALGMFLYVYSQRGIAQAELGWAAFSYSICRPP